MQRKLLHANQRVREVDQAIDLVMVAGLDADAPVALLKGNFFANQQGAPRQRLFDNAGLLDHFGKHFRRTIKDRNLQIVDIDINVVDARPRNADSRCSTVESITPVRMRVVA